MQSCPLLLSNSRVESRRNSRNLGARANSCISGMVLETKSNAPKQASSSDSTNGAKSAMQSMSINKAAASSSASAAAAADFEDISCKERFKCTGQEIFNALTQREMIQVAADILCCEIASVR